MYYKSCWGNTLKAFDKKHYKMKIELHEEVENVDYWFKLNRTVLNDTHMEGLALLLSSVQKFIEIQSCLLLTFFTCLHNQLSSLNSIIVQMSEKRDS